MACSAPPYAFAPPYGYPPPQQPGPPPGFMGRTQYNYFTRDGGPPNKGAVPSAGPPAGGGPPGPYGFFPPGPSPAPQPGPFLIPPGPGFPGAFCVPGGPAPPGPPPPPPPPSWGQPPPPPGAGPTNVGGAVAYAAAQHPEPPVSGNRVNDRLLVVKDSGGTGHIASKYNATFHLFTNNIIARYPLNTNSQFQIPHQAQEPFRVMTVAYSMPVEEFIEQLDCIKDVPTDYARANIGIAEAFDMGDGLFQVGKRYMLGQFRPDLTVKDFEGQSIGMVGGRSRPRYVIRIPGKPPS